MSVNIPTSLPAPSEQPAVVNTAIRLFYLLLFIGIVRSFVALPRIEHSLFPAVTLFLLVFSAVSNGWLIGKMDKGRNWARIILLAIFVLGGPPLIVGLVRSLSHSPISGGLGLLSVALHAMGFIMIFSRTASPWFHQEEEQPDPRF